MNLAQEKIEAFKAIVLKSGSHKSFEDGVCAMEAVAWLAGEKHSAKPECACPALTSFVQKLNDRWTHEDRQLLKPYLLRLIGTRNGKDKERGKFIVFKSITSILPVVMEAGNLSEFSEKLRKLEFGDWGLARTLCREARDVARRRSTYEYSDTLPYIVDVTVVYSHTYIYAYKCAVADLAAYAAAAAHVATKTLEERLYETQISTERKVIDATLTVLDEAIDIK